MIVRNDLDGVLLFDKKTGLNVLLDEDKPSKVDLAPRHVSIALTENCNLMCNQCYINHSSRSLNYEDVISWTDALYENGCLSIGLGGGEPTLWYKCLDIVSYINTTQMAVTLTTNGSASVDFYCKLLHNASVVRFSLDGLNDVYESRRKQNYNDIIKKIIFLKDEGRIGLNYLLTDESVFQLREFEDVVSLVHPSEILLIPFLDKNGEYLLSKSSQEIVSQWVRKNKDCLPLCGSYSCLGFLQEDVLPTQNFELKQQHYYFLHINAKKQLMRNVFDKQSIDIGENFINSLQTYRRS